MNRCCVTGLLLSAIVVTVGCGDVGTPTTEPATQKTHTTSILGAVASKPAKRATLGVETRPPTAEEVRKFGLPNIYRHSQGRVVSVVVGGGPAAQAGLKVDDVLLALDDNKLFSSDDIRDFLRASQPNAKVRVTIKRASTFTEETVTVTLDATIAADQGKHFTWQYAGLGQFDVALASAIKDRKLVLVGLSGADT